MKSGMHNARFEKTWGMLIANDRTDIPFYQHYAFLFIMKRTAFVYVGFYLYEPVYTLLQIILTVWISLGFAVYLIHIMPHKDKLTNKIEIYNEICYLLLSYTLFLLTDFNPDAEVKNTVGWYMVGISAFNLICPNLLFLVYNLIISIKEACIMIYNEIKNCRQNSKERRRVKALKNLEKSRIRFISNYNKKLKAEFWKPPDLKDYITFDLRDNQVIAIEQDYQEPNIYITRSGGKYKH
jgi:hypothetical protein